MKGIFKYWLLGALVLAPYSGVFGQNDTDAEVLDTPTADEVNADLDMDMEDEVMGGNVTETDVDVVANFTAPTMAPTTPTMPPSTAEGCYNDLDSIYLLISDDDMLFQQKRFVICPGSVMEVGFLVPGVGIDQGQSPLIPRSNTEFLCGEDGKSENNCIIKGGDFGLIAVPVFFRQDLSINNVQIKGFTFEGQVQYASFVASAGDIAFIDCVFRDSANFGPMVFNYDSTLDLSRRLQEAEEFDSPWDYAHDYITKYREGTLPTRRLTAEEEEDEALLPGADRSLQGEVFEATIKDCLFSNLQQVERKLGVEFGVISIKSPDHVMNFEDCTFANNEYGNQELTPIGYGILVQGAEVTMNGNCFIDNDFRGNGVVLLEQTANPLVAENNYLSGNYATEDENLDCQFVAWFATDEDRRNSNFTCVAVQTDTCGGEPISAPRETSAPAPEGADSSGSTQSLLLAGLASFGLLVLGTFS